MHLQTLVSLVGLLATAASLSASPFQRKCAALADKIELDLPFAVNIATYLPPDVAVDGRAEGINETCLDPDVDIVAEPIPVGVCRLNLRVETTSASEVYMEVWLPENWTGRLLTTGNGGLAGCIQYTELAYGAAYGFASFGSNGGHNGTSGGAFYRQPEVLADWIWRGVPTAAHVGKSVAKQFYGRDGGKSYYIGCSTGGRQGFRAVQRDPELFDGVIAGAPAINQFAHISWFANGYRVLGRSINDSLVSQEQWEEVQEQVFKQCDALDGASDGILEDPTACEFDWTPLMCRDDDDDNNNDNNTLCFTQAQVDAAAQLFAPITYNGTQLYPGQVHGTEPDLISFLYNKLVPNWVADGFRYIVFNDASWDPTTFTLQDAYYAATLNPHDAATFDSDISAFRDRGGKLLHWHGMADTVLEPTVSNQYYRNVQTALGASVAELDEFYRYFRAGGVGHCRGGPGANFMGQMGERAAASDPDDNMLMRIVAWVERGEAPVFVRGTKFVDDDETQAVEFRRRHCKFPLVNQYTGKGNGTDEQAWECIEAYS